MTPQHDARTIRADPVQDGLGRHAIRTEAVPARSMCSRPGEPPSGPAVVLSPRAGHREEAVSIRSHESGGGAGPG